MDETPEAPVKDKEYPKVTDSVIIHSTQTLSTISDLFWGTNFLFWIEDDESLSDFKIASALKNLSCNILRYPGGTVADNYHWKTNKLDNIYMFPYEDGETESDFDEFMAFCKMTGAEPMIVVNTQSWFLKDDVAGGAREAADWVKYCKDKGYRVKYWEIGNETYWHPVMTAREYGKLVNDYSAAMKAVDPEIIISANGHWDINMVGTKERIPDKYWQEIKTRYHAIGSRQDSDNLKTFIDQNTKKPITSGTDKWWDCLLAECHDAIDMISVHWYYFDNNLPSIEKKLKELKEKIHLYSPDKDMLFCMSEYNCNTKNISDRVLGLVEGICSFLNSGTDISCIWPLRMASSSAEENTSMMTLNKKEEQYPLQIFREFQACLKGSMIVCTCSNGIKSFASYDRDNACCVISGKSLEKETDIKVKFDINLSGKNIIANIFSISNEGNRIFLQQNQAEEITDTDNAEIYLKIKPETFIILTISNQ